MGRRRKAWASRADWYRRVFHKALRYDDAGHKFVAVTVIKGASFRYLDTTMMRVPSWVWRALFRLKATGELPDSQRREIRRYFRGLRRPAYSLNPLKGFLHLIREYELASMVRDAAITEALGARRTIARLQAHFDSGDLENCKQVLNSNPTLHTATPLEALFGWYLDLLQGRAVSPLFTEDNDEHFLPLIQGKTIAVVGPVDNGLANGKEIDDFDVVVRTNPFTWQDIDSKKRGSRVDVGYYALNLWRFMEQHPEDIPDLRCIVLKKFNKTLYERYNCIRTYWPLPLFFSGVANAIPNCVYDLLRFQPARIKIFNADLMLTLDYDDGYVDVAKPYTRDARLIKKLDVFSQHEPAMQFRALHLVWSRGFIEGDSRFEQIMDYGYDGYLRRMTNVANGRAE